MTISFGRRGGSHHMNVRGHEKFLRNLPGKRLLAIALTLIALVVILNIPVVGAIAQDASSQRRAVTANTVLVSSAFAAGTGGSAMTPTHYRKSGAPGQAGLPAHQNPPS